MRASETFEIPATMLTVFFLAAESFTPADNRLPGKNEALWEFGEGYLRCPIGDGCRYLDSTIIAASFDTFRFSSFARTKLGTTHFEGAGDPDLFPFPAGDGSFSADTGFFFPTDTNLFAPAGDENLEAGRSEIFLASSVLEFEFTCPPELTLSRGARGCLDSDETPFFRVEL
ncbi:hypothetical protein D8674_031180 [Pyrus ussuriensis x Pyrus communis]|uniref:Uncharacterized protein n=1 Tax=Pyrus ussuriensis x Pyrus communis TaxID=2448454 RepID=A0A5N5F3F2_9ROSA|nr:hypothetical protein D8674_031180 [Pyrus ussuriensis x Pyrus communis]